jgi:uncharacterized protein (DUF302 family)
MPTIEVQVRRFNVVSVRPFEQVMARLTATIGRPELTEFRRSLLAASTFADVEATVQRAVGPSQLMEFVRFDPGEVLRKEGNGKGPMILRLPVGNPLIMKEMARYVAEAAAYAPVTILVDERSDGVHLTYDSMESLIAPYGSHAASAVARALDAKVEDLLESAAR